MTEARRIDCPSLMQNNPFPLRVASRNSLRLNATQPGSSYGRLPFAMSRYANSSQAGFSVPDCNRFQENHAGTQLNPTPSASPLALSPSKGRPEPVKDPSYSSVRPELVEGPPR